MLMDTVHGEWNDEKEQLLNAVLTYSHSGDLNTVRCY